MQIKAIALTASLKMTPNQTGWAITDGSAGCAAKSSSPTTWPTSNYLPRRFCLAQPAP